jgi:aconitate hydratase
VKTERLQLLAPFVMGRENITDAKLLIKAFGKCTTDHISMTMVGVRGHLDNISNNMLIVINALNKKKHSWLNHWSYDVFLRVAQSL